jgi:predicted DNA-binding protein
MRPLEPRTTQSRMIQLRLTEELKGQLEALSQETDFTVSELVRACITRALPYVEAKAKLVTSQTTITDTQ